MLQTQILSIFLHIISNYFFVLVMRWGVAGSGFATIVTNLFILVCNVWQTNRFEKIQKELQISFFDKRVWKEFGAYL
jgi:Na+-driven multidrug efflux pump